MKYNPCTIFLSQIYNCHFFTRITFLYKYKYFLIHINTQIDIKSLISNIIIELLTYDQSDKAFLC